MKKILCFFCLDYNDFYFFCRGKKPLPDELNAEVKSVISLRDANQEVMKSLLEGTQSDVAIECEKGTMIPIKYFGNFKFLSLNCDPNLSSKLEESTQEDDFN